MNLRRHTNLHGLSSPIPPEVTSPEETSTCPSPVRADLKAYADHELGPLRRATVRLHLSRCPDCREELNQMKKITEMFAAADADQTAFAPQLRSRVLSRLDGLGSVGGIAPASAPTPTRPLPLWRKQPALVFGGGGTALAASLAVFFTMNASHTPSTAETQTTSAPSYGRDYDEKSPTTATAAGKAAPADSESDKAPGYSVVAPGASTRDFRAEDSGTNRPAAVPAPLAMSAAPVADGSFAVPASPNMMRTDTEVARQGTVNGRVAAPRAVRAPATPLRPVNKSAMGGGAAGMSAVLADTDDGRQVHKEASLGLRVNPGGLQAASDKVEELVKSTGGFVASNNLSTDDTTGEKSADLTVRVPVKDFESVMAALAKMGNVVSKQVTGEDITEKTTDATTAEQVLVSDAQETARKLASQSMSERRTGQKEAELRQIRMQLAQTRARLGLLRKMAALSTINVSLTEKPVKKTVVPPITKGSFFTGMQETNHAAMQAFQTAVRVPLVLLIWVLAFSPIWVPLIIAYRWASLKTLANRAFPPTNDDNAHS